MIKLKLLLVSLFIINIAFANTPKNIKENTNKVEEVESFQSKSIKSVKKLLRSKRAPLFFISRKNLKIYYKTFDYQLIWVDENGIKNIALELLEAIKQDPVLKPHAKKAFNLNKLINTLNTLDTTPQKYVESMTKIDFMLTGVYSRYMWFLSRGYIKWKDFKVKLRELDEKEEINAGWEKYNVRKNAKKLLLKAIKENDLSYAFDEVNFTYPNANKLIEKITELEELSKNGGYIKIPKVKVLKFGQKSKNVKLLRQRLIQSNDLVSNNCDTTINAHSIITNHTHTQNRQNGDEPSVLITEGSDIIEDNCYETFDEKVKEAVISFQKSHGLEADGIVGSTTRKYLNIPVEEKISQIRLNLERMRWMPRSLGEKYLLVNIPEYKLKMFEDEKVKLSMRIVVGTKKHPTPIFSNRMSFVVLNPYWRIPHSIVRKEIIPEILKNPNYLNEKGINIHPNWDHQSEQVAGETIDWPYYLNELNRLEEEKKQQSLIKDENSIEKEPVPIYRFIQVPSNTNPLGRMKFMFPNKYSVYLHDSPAKQFFKYTKRAYSHGCVRLAEPKKLLEAIASKDENLDFTEANEILKEIDKTKIDLTKQIPVHLVYLTSWVDENGKLQFREDIYKYDSMQKELLYNRY